LAVIRYDLPTQTFRFDPVIRHFLPRLFLAWTLIVQGAAVHAGNINLPDLGDASATVVSPAQERRLGEEFMRYARQSLAFADDPEMNDYLQALGQRLLAHADTPSKDYRFFMVNDPTVNAFAVPGGFIGIHRGLFLATQAEGELASVLAHEITHVSQRHIPRLIAESNRVTLPAMAAILASILLAGAGHGQAAEAGIALTTAAVTQRGINFTREFEEEADRLGMATLARAGFDPHAMPAFFERMQTLTRANESDLPEFLRTHPVTTNRISDARNRAERLPKRLAADSDDYLHVHAKLRAMGNGNSAEVVRGFRDNLESGKYRNVHAERYGYALALLRVRDIGAARAQAHKLVTHQPNRVYYRVLQAEIELAAQQTDQALAIYAQAHKAAPNHPGLLRHYAAALLQARQNARAYELLKTAVRQVNDDPLLYRQLAQAAGDSGQPLEAHKAMAEHYYLNGNRLAAMEQLRLALRYACDNFYQSSSIEARLTAIREELALFDPKAAARTAAAAPTGRGDRPAPQDCAKPAAGTR
jgi:predicted Zn-dependent protease